MSIYDPVNVGPLKIEPGMINADYVQVTMSTEREDETDTSSQPYVQDGAIYVPVRVWEQMQEAGRPTTMFERFFSEAEGAKRA